MIKPSHPRSKSEWRRVLTPLQYAVLREKATEQPFSGKYNAHSARGRYMCAGCHAALFASSAKFESGCGWPSFDRAEGKDAVAEAKDLSHGMCRTEVVCATCRGHLGHLFDDGPTETGLRYCINSASLSFIPHDDAEKPKECN